jgi:hypothetical protein
VTAQERSALPGLPLPALGFVHVEGGVVRQDRQRSSFNDREVPTLYRTVPAASAPISCQHARMLSVLSDQEQPPPHGSEPLPDPVSQTLMMRCLSLLSQAQGVAAAALALLRCGVPPEELGVICFHRQGGLSWAQHGL